MASASNKGRWRAAMSAEVLPPNMVTDMTVQVWGLSRLQTR